MTLTKVLAVALCCAAFALGGTSASARDFFANAGTTFILVPVADTAPQQFTHTVDGVVQVRHLGSCKVHFDLIVTATADPNRPYNVAGTQTITTADGKSTVTSAVAGYLSANPDNPTFLGINYKMTFTGGTGTLAGARGKTVLTGFAALSMQPGTIDYPDGPEIDPVDADLMEPASGNLTGKACWTMKGAVQIRGEK